MWKNKMKGALPGLLLLVICFGCEAVSAQAPLRDQGNKSRGTPPAQRMELQLKQQKSQIALLKRELAERDAELHSLLRLLSGQSNISKRADKEENPDDLNSSDDEQQDSDDSCDDTLYARQRGAQQSPQGRGTPVVGTEQKLGKR